MTITFTDSLANLHPEHFTDFFRTWTQAPPPAVHFQLLAQSAASVLAIDEGSGRVVGYLALAVDPAGQAYVPFLEVLPAYQGQGLTAELTRRMMAKLAPALGRDAEPSAPWRRVPRLEHRAGA